MAKNTFVAEVTFNEKGFKTWFKFHFKIFIRFAVQNISVVQIRDWSILFRGSL